LLYDRAMLVKDLIKQEKKRQREQLSLIASENYAPKEVREASASVFMNKYSEGYPGKRYYGGNKIVDKLETYTQDLVKKIFGAEHANVQPYSGTPANLAVYLSVLNFGDTVLSMALDQGGHLSHGHSLSFSGQAYRFVFYGVDRKTERIDYKKLEALAKKYKPKMIVAGASAYSRKIDFKKISGIAQKIGAYSLADISHIAGLVAVGQHKNPAPYFDFVVTTTHKTLRGPRGAIIMCKKKFASQVDKAVFPGIQGGPHNHTIAAKAACLELVQELPFKKYIQQVVANAQTFAGELKKKGWRIISGGTDNHLFLVDVFRKGITGAQAETALEEVSIIVNKNMIPYDRRKPLNPSGIRIGTPAVTTRGMKEREMKKLAELVDETLKNITNLKKLERIKKEVSKLVKKFPVPE